MPGDIKDREDFYVISTGRCEPSVISSWHETWPMVSGYPKNEYKGFEMISAAGDWLSRTGHDTFHFFKAAVDGYKTESSEYPRGGRPACYVAANGQEEAAVIEKYDHVKEYFGGCKSSTQKSYPDTKAAEVVFQRLVDSGQPDGSLHLNE